MRLQLRVKVAKQHKTVFKTTCLSTVTREKNSLKTFTAFPFSFRVLLKIKCVFFFKVIPRESLFKKEAELPSRRFGGKVVELGATS